MVVDNDQKSALVIHIAMSSDRSVRKKEYEKLEEFQRLLEQLEMMWKVKAEVISVITVAPN